MKIKLRSIKACEKKNPSCVSGMDRQICLEDQEASHDRAVFY